MTIDAVLERYGPPASVPLPPWLRGTRRRVTAAVEELLRIEDRDLDHRWWWRDDPDGGTEVRYAFYRAVEALERATAQVARTVAQPGARPFGLATMARWDLHGLLSPLSDADLDADPGGGEWTIRQTLAHAVNVQRAYPSFGSWWLSREQTPELPRQIPDEVGEGFPDEDDDGAGSLAEIRQRLDDAMDGAAERLAALDDPQLATPARWSGYAVDVGFRLGRMSSHLQEHTVQVEKTLAMLGRAPREAERLARLVFRAYGRLEASVYGVPIAAAERGHEHLLAAIDELVEVADHVQRPGSVSEAGDADDT